jgi:serine phosphatase RsbU (regulator of sigma subunit)
VTHDLLSVAERQSRQITAYLREREKSVTALARMPNIITAMKEYAWSVDKERLFTSEYRRVDRNHRPFLQNYRESFGYEDLFLITLDGRIIFSVKQGEDLGTNLKNGILNQTELAKAVEQAGTVLETGISDFEYYPATNEPAAFIAAPVLGNNRILGVVALQLNNETLYSIVNDFSGLGKTGETVVASKIGDRAVFQTPTRHDLYAAFRRKVLIGSGRDQGLEQAVLGKRGQGLIRDYRQKECLAVWKYAPELRWGMVTKIDTAEAFAPVVRLRNLALLIAGITFVLVIISAFFVARSFSAPIKKLTGITRVIAEGNLEQRIEVTTGNEIGVLAESFNVMTSRLSESREQLRLTTAAKERIESELAIAKEIQLGMIPRTFPPFPDRKEFDLFALIEPAREVGGDLYDFFLLDPDHLCFLVGDVSGKGIPAALFMAVTSTLIRAISLKGQEAGEILTRANEKLGQDNDSCMFASLFYGILNLKTGEVVYANAGHNPPVAIRRNDSPAFLKVEAGLALAMMEETAYRSQTLTLRPGDSLVLYTDGVPEAMNEQQELFSDERLLTALASLQGLDPADRIKGLMTNLRDFTQGAEQSDDITLLMLTYNGTGVSS